jgi:hypothetical protein
LRRARLAIPVAALIGTLLACAIAQHGFTPVGLPAAQEPRPDR